MFHKILSLCTINITVCVLIFLANKIAEENAILSLSIRK